MTNTTPNSMSPPASAGTVSPLRLALSLSMFFGLSYIFCVASALILPPGTIAHRLLGIVPGFGWNPPGIVMGLVVAIGGGIYTGVVFDVIHRSMATLVGRAFIPGRSTP